MNINLQYLSLNYFYSISPFLFSNRNNYKIKGISYLFTFNSFFHTFSSNLLYLRKGLFSNLLNTPLIFNRNNFFQQNFTSKPNFIPDLNNFIYDCIFWKIETLTQCSGIYVNSNINISINRCGFYKLYNSVSYGSSSIYILTANVVIMKQLCFEFCRSAHGASFGIHSNQGNVNNLEFTLSSESFVGYTGSQTHSSYFGAKNYLKFETSNISYIISSGNAGSFYILNSQENVQFKYVQASDSNLPTIFFTINPSLKMNFENFNFINLTVSYYFRVGDLNYIIKSCVFNLVSSNVLWANQKSNLLSFINCSFSQIRNDNYILSASIINCNFQYFQSYNLINNLNTFYCWAQGNFISSKNPLKIFLFIF